MRNDVGAFIARAPGPQEQLHRIGVVLCALSVADVCSLTFWALWTLLGNKGLAYTLSWDYGRA